MNVKARDRYVSHNYNQSVVKGMTDSCRVWMGKTERMVGETCNSSGAVGETTELMGNWERRRESSLEGSETTERMSRNS